MSIEMRFGMSLGMRARMKVGLSLGIMLAMSLGKRLRGSIGMKLGGGMHMGTRYRVFIPGLFHCRNGSATVGCALLCHGLGAGLSCNFPHDIFLLPALLPAQSTVGKCI